MEKRFRRGLVALSADPVTYGHLDIIERASEECEHVVVLIAENERKRSAGAYLFELEERRVMTEKAVARHGVFNAEIIASSGLLIDIWLREDCDALFRGVRNPQDRDYEEEQAEINALILPEIENRFVYLKTKPELRHVSSTLVKAFVEHGLDVTPLVPMFVKQALEERMLGQFRLAITGGIAVGKSWVAAELCRQAEADGVPSRHVNVDALIRELYDEHSPGAQHVREALARRFGDEVLGPSRETVDRRALADRLFSAPTAAERDFVAKLTMPHIQRLYRKAIANAKGLVILEWAQLAEMGMGSWTNGNVVIVDSPDRERFAATRGIAPERFDELARFQMSSREKFTLLKTDRDAIEHGRVQVFQNHFADDPHEAELGVTPLYRQLVRNFPGLRALSKRTD